MYVNVNHVTLTKTTLLICKANVKIVNERQRERERKLRAFLLRWRWKASHVLFCFSPAGEKERLNWSVICWQPCYLFHGNSGPPTPFPLSLFRSLSHYHSIPVHLSHTQPYSISLFLALHLVQYKDDKVTHLRLNFPAVLEAQDQSAYTEKNVFGSK